MKKYSQNSDYSILKHLKIPGLVLVLLFVFTPFLHAQNTKGDTPAQKQSRESKFKGRANKSKSKGIFGKRLKTRKSSRASKANANYPVPNTARKSPKGGDGRVGKPLNPIFSSQPGRNRTNVYPQGGRYGRFTRKSVKGDQERMSTHVQRAPGIRSATGRISNVYPQRGRYARFMSRSPRKANHPIYSNRSKIAQLRSSKSLQGPGKGQPSRVGGGTTTRPKIYTRSINPFSGFWNKKHKGEKAWTRDISGRKLRTKNYQTPKPGVQPQPNIYYGRKRIGDRPYKGPTGGYRSATQTGRAWKGDISGRRIRGKNFASKKKTEVVGKNFSFRKNRPGYGDRPYKGTIPGRGNISITGKTKTGNNRPLPPKTPGIGARGIGEYSGNIKGRKSFRPQGEGYSGSIRARKPAKGGGSVSAMWNNRNRPINGKTPGIGAKGVGEYQGNLRVRNLLRNQGEEYSGNIKARRPAKGGGSISGKLWNNGGRAIAGKSPGIGVKGIGNYQGNLRQRNTLRNQGEEYSGNIRQRNTLRNQGEEYSGNIRQRNTLRNQGEEYSGNIKTKKPEKGGGSISGMWNNQGKPINGKSPGIGAKGIGEYQGNIRARRTLQNQGEEFTGYIKAKKPKKGAGESISGQLWNNREKPIDGKSPGIGAKGIAEYTGNIKAKKPKKGAGESISGKLWNNNETPIPVRTPQESQGEEFRGSIRLSRFRSAYVHNPNSAKEAIRVRREEPTTKMVDNIYGKIKQYDYKHNPSSAKDALSVREPGRAFGRVTDYQGNIKMKKFDLFARKGFHPDSQFMKINENNVKGERSFMTNIKLLWGKLFRKNSTQPQNIKEKYHKPRYDKGEQGLWYD